MGESRRVVQSSKIDPPERESRCSVEEFIGGNPFSEWTRDEGSVEVNLDVLVVREESGMSKARCESRPWLSITASKACQRKCLERVAPLRVANKQINVAKWPERGIGVYPLRQGRSLQHDRIHSSGFQTP
jgi:hypothetical protein